MGVNIKTKLSHNVFFFSFFSPTFTWGDFIYTVLDFNNSWLIESYAGRILKNPSIFAFFHKPSLKFLNCDKKPLLFTPGDPCSFWENINIELTSP